MATRTVKKKAVKKKAARVTKTPIKKKLKAPPKGRAAGISADAPLFAPPNNRELRNREKKRRFIEALRECGTITGACRLAGLSRHYYYFWTDPKYAPMYGRKEMYDPEFTALAQDALLGEFNDKILETGYSRALDGWVRRKYDRNGVLMEEEHLYDSSILQMLMKRADPNLKDKGGDVNLAVSQRNETVVQKESAEVLDELTPGQKRLLLAAVQLEEREAIEGEVIDKG